MAHTHTSPKSVPRRYSTANGFTTVRGVRQDKSASKRARIASPQPAPPKKMTRSRQLNTLSSRSQNDFKDSFLTKISSISFPFSLAWVDMSYPASTVQARKHSQKRQMVQLTIWLKPSVKAEIPRIAKMEGL